MRIFKFSALLVLGFVFAVYAATIKRPLTVKTYAKQYYLEWTGSAPTVTADDVEFSADTSGTSKGFDPFYLLYNKKVSVGEEKVFPGEEPFRNLCIAVTAGGDADATSSLVHVNQSATASGTFVKTVSLSDTIVTAGATKITEIVARPHSPFLFNKVVVDPVSSTDSVEVTAVRIWPCAGR